MRSSRARPTSRCASASMQTAKGGRVDVVCLQRNFTADLLCYLSLQPEVVPVLIFTKGGATCRVSVYQGMRSPS